MGKNIGFVSTRFAGTDGVTLEASKWAEVLRGMGYECFWFAGELDRAPERSYLAPEAHFTYEKNEWINHKVLGRKGRSPEVTVMIHTIRAGLKAKLYEFINQFNIDLLITQNCQTIPMHIPLGVALAEVLAESEIPTIAHHHDFYWERTRFSVNGVGDYLQMAFPPKLPNIQHVVINSLAQEELALRTGITSIVIPNVLDFENPTPVDEEKGRQFKEDMGLAEGDVLILQPTRIVQRKGIEHAIELVQQLKDPKYKLVISHQAGDEGMEYAEWLQNSAHEHGVDLRLMRTSMTDPWGARHQAGEEGYTLWDAYPHADFVTYPSLYEGFGNAFLEAIYFKKPILVNRYSIFVRDIEPLGFDLMVMDGYVDKKMVDEVRGVLESPERRTRMVEKNYALANRYYSYSVLRKRLNFMLMNVFGKRDAV